MERHFVVTPTSDVINDMEDAASKKDCIDSSASSASSAGPVLGTESADAGADAHGESSAGSSAVRANVYRGEDAADAADAVKPPILLGGSTAGRPPGLGNGDGVDSGDQQEEPDRLEVNLP